ncbi:hypothetical protein MHB48_11955 [Psychrobacillus sp. FSL H8-0483]
MKIIELFRQLIFFLQLTPQELPLDMAALLKIMQSSIDKSNLLVR